MQQRGTLISQLGHVCFRILVGCVTSGEMEERENLPRDGNSFMYSRIGQSEPAAHSEGVC